MTSRPRDTDSEILNAPRAFRPDDPEQTLTQAELDLVLSYFASSKHAEDPKLVWSIQMQFQSFMDMAERERPDSSPKKPTTKVKRDMSALQKVCEKLDAHLEGLDQHSKTWLDLHLKEHYAGNSDGRPVRFRDLKESIDWPLDVLMAAARSAENLTSKGPNNAALRAMVEGLASTWEKCHGAPPRTDRGRGHQEDPFLELCQLIAQMAHDKLTARGGGLATLNLSGIVAEVLNQRSRQAAVTPPEK